MNYFNEEPILILELTLKTKKKKVIRVIILIFLGELVFFWYNQEGTNVSSPSEMKAGSVSNCRTALSVSLSESEESFWS